MLSGDDNSVVWKRTTKLLGQHFRYELISYFACPTYNLNVQTFISPSNWEHGIVQCSIIVHIVLCQVRVSRDADVQNHDLGGVIARACKGRKTRGTEIKSREVEVPQFRVIQTEPRATSPTWILKVTQGSVLRCLSAT